MNVKRLNEIKKLIEEVPTKLKMRLLLEEMGELIVNYNLEGKPTIICIDCCELKHSCFYEYNGKLLTMCKYCRLLREQRNQKHYVAFEIYCKVCNCSLVSSSIYKKKFVLEAHESTQKHMRNVRGY